MSMKFVLTSDPQRRRELTDIQTQILDEVYKQKFNSDSVFAIKLALEESLINAVKHGNKNDPNKNVHVEAIINPRQVDLIIEDEGPGFDRSIVPDPTAPENLEKSSGRGILLIESYMTSVDYSHNGRRVHMVKRND